tara:strand:+ start:754 stop:969 length:216 start_codon:yes stop_codon:yes gene_type:complete
MTELEPMTPKQLREGFAHSSVGPVPHLFQYLERIENVIEELEDECDNLRRRYDGVPVEAVRCYIKMLKGEE